MLADLVVVEDDAHILQLAGLVELFEFHQDSTVGGLFLDDKEGGVDQSVDNGCIGNDIDRHAVDDDDFVVLAGPVDELVEAFAHKELGGVGWYWAVVDDLQVGIDGVAFNQLFERFVLCREVGGEAVFVFLLCAVPRFALADVGVDKQHFFACVGKRQGYVVGNKALSVARHCRGHHQHASAFHFAVHKQDVVAEYAEGLVESVFAALGDDAAAVALYHRDDAGHGDGAVCFDILLAADAHVEEFDEQDHSDGNQQGNDECH